MPFVHIITMLINCLIALHIYFIIKQCQTVCIQIPELLFSKSQKGSWFPIGLSFNHDNRVERLGCYTFHYKTQWSAHNDNPTFCISNKQAVYLLIMQEQLDAWQFAAGPVRVQRPYLTLHPHPINATPHLAGAPSRKSAKVSIGQSRMTSCASNPRLAKPFA